MRKRPREFGKGSGIRFTGEERFQDGASRGAADIGHDGGELNVRVFEHGLQAIREAGTLLNEMSAVARETAEVALGGGSGGGQAERWE